MKRQIKGLLCVLSACLGMGSIAFGQTGPTTDQAVRQELYNQAAENFRKAAGLYEEVAAERVDNTTNHASKQALSVPGADGLVSVS